MEEQAGGGAQQLGPEVAENTLAQPRWKFWNPRELPSKDTVPSATQVRG